MVEYIRIAVWFAAGIYLSERISVPFAAIFIISLIMVLTIQAIFKHKFNKKILAALCALTVGIFLCAYASSTEMSDLSRYENRYVTITGRVSGIPDDDGENTRCTIDVRRVEHSGEERDVRETVLLTTDSKCVYGDTVTFSGFIDKISVKMNENGFDFEKYYKGKGIFYKIYSSEVLPSRDTIKDYSPAALVTGAKNFICETAEKIYPGDYGAILKAVLTGNKKDFSDDFDRVLVRTGLKRFYYPAFLHVILFISLITLLTGAVEKKKRDALTVFLLILYACANFSNAVFLRLTVMTALLIFLKSRYGEVYYPDVIGMTAIIMGILNPLTYFDIGFIMSMLSCIMIYYFFDTVYAALKFIKIKYIRRMSAIGLICTVGLIPVTAYFFTSVPLCSVFVSLIMLPCVAVLVILSPLLIGLWTLFKAAPVIKQASSCMLFVLKYIPLLADKLKFLNVTLPNIGILFLIIYLLVVVAAVKHIKHKRSHAYAALFTAAALSVSPAAHEAARLNDIEITFVNVGQGDGALIRAPYRFNVLIDGGGGNAYSDYNPGEKVYLAYLKAEGINEADSAFVSHYHKDHVQGIIAAIENIKVRNVFLPDEMEGSEWRVAVEKAAHEHGTVIHYLSEETLIKYNNGMTIHAIPPAAAASISGDENDTSYIYRVEYGDFSAMFTGDMSSFAEKCLLNNGKVPQTDLLKVAHHGSPSATSAEWVDAVSPRYAVISLGYDNMYGFPDDTVLENLSDAEIYRTDFDGDVRFTAEKSGVTDIRTFNRKE